MRRAGSTRRAGAGTEEAHGPPMTDWSYCGVTRMAHSGRKEKGLRPVEPRRGAYRLTCST
eukprot:scaffold11431_cov118-Isochrysis_galbana.AAC.7